MKTIATLQGNARNYTIFCDSKSVLQSIECFDSKHPIILKILEWLFLIQKRGKIINFCWVPAHVDITGNERADRLAKEAAINSIPRPYPIPSSDFIPAITKEIRELWQFRWDLELNNKMREISTSTHPWLYAEIPPLNSVNILGLQISSSLSWRDHIVQIAKSASKKLGVLFRCKQYFNSAQLFKLYTGFIRPCLEYCSHIWGSSPYTSLLDRVESKAIRLISDPSLTSTLDPLSLRRKVASLSLFYRYYFGHCSDELAACIPPPMARPRSTRQATFAHNYCVELSNARINRFSDGFFPSTSHLWNSLPSAVFPASFNLPSFKRQVYHHLRDQMA